MAENLIITTLSEYFKEGINQVSKLIQSKLNTYKGITYPLEICLSTEYNEGTLLGTLTFVKLDENGYPTYSGVVSDKKDNYSAELVFNVKTTGNWAFKITPMDIGIGVVFSSLPTDSIDPTLVEYDGISAPTSGACVI